MYTQLSFNELLAAIKKQIEKGTELKCYDAVPQDAESPFYFIQIIQSRPDDTKTMYRTNYQVLVHSIADPSKSSVPVNKLIQKLEESLTEDIKLPEEFRLIMQTNQGVQAVKEDETGEKHAISLYQLSVCYGFKYKI